MPYRIKGTLKLPSGQPSAGVDIEFISRRNYSPLLMDLSSIIKTTSTGAYDITLEFGEYAVVVYWGCNQPSHIGKLFVFSDTAAGLDLQTLLQQSDWQPATPEYIQQIHDWLGESRLYSLQSEASAVRAENAAMAMTGAILDGGQCDLSSGFYPQPLTVNGKKYSTVWYVKVGGTVGGITYDAGDKLQYTTANSGFYFRIDARDDVVSVNGKKGAVTLNAQEVGADPAGSANTLIDQHAKKAGAHPISGVSGLQNALDRKYSTDNIVGTVSQSGGVPTGAIIQRGSNANGEFVRFADGTQICTRYSVTNSPVGPNGRVNADTAVAAAFYGGAIIAHYEVTFFQGLNGSGLGLYSFGATSGRFVNSGQSYSGEFSWPPEIGLLTAQSYIQENLVVGRWY